MASEDMCPCDYCTGKSYTDYIKKQKEETRSQNIKKVRWGRRKTRDKE